MVVTIGCPEFLQPRSGTVTTVEISPPVEQTHAPAAESHAPALENPFELTELKQFGEDDAEAGRAIGKMLSLFFVYTVLAMTVSLLATIGWIRSTSM